MEVKDIHTRVRQLIAENINVAIDDIKPTTLLMDELAVDSIEMVDIATSIAKVFSIEINKKLFAELNKVADVFAFVEKAYLDFNECYVIDMVNTEDLALAKENWNKASCFLSGNPGFIFGELLEVFDKIETKYDYQLASMCGWKNVDLYQKARELFRHSEVGQRIKSMPAKFEPTICKKYYSQGKVQHFSADNMVLVDVVALDESQMDGYAEMWKCARDYMKDKDGFVNVNLYRSINPGESKFKFINIAKWETKEKFVTALKTKDFMEIVDDYKDFFSLFLCHSVDFFDANTKRVSEKVAEGIAR